MCGIIGYTGHRSARDVIVEGLKRLEYRGYDSAGVAISSNELAVFKEKGEISALEVEMPPMEGNIGIGHTRWATCGPPSMANAHPFVDNSGRLAIVHNGIIENHLALRESLLAEGHRFSSDTDTEVLIHLLARYYQGDLRAALSSMLAEVEGTFAIAVVEAGSDRVLAARCMSPLIVGLGVGENFMASDVTAMLEYTNQFIYVEDGEVVEARPDGVSIWDAEGNPVWREPTRVDWSLEDAQRGGFEHFMLKEIFEEPDALRNTIVAYLDDIESRVLVPPGVFNQVKIIACGSSYHAGMVGKYIIEELAMLPTTVELASEYRYSPGCRERPLIILITQSGETLDTIAACREARKRGCSTLAITNVVGSTITREADAVMYTMSGPEISVAATKTFVCQLISLYLLGMNLGALKGTLPPARLRSLKNGLRSLPKTVSVVLERAPELEAVATVIARSRDVFFIGRNVNYPSMLEAALKLKEISYIHAEGYAAGELKHGPLALLDDGTPVIACCVRDHTYGKMVSNLMEAAARGAPVMALMTDGDEDLPQLANLTVSLPEVDPLFTPLPVAVACQLLAYNVALKMERPIDRPRNLAKSVTVE